MKPVNLARPPSYKRNDSIELRLELLELQSALAKQQAVVKAQIDRLNIRKSIKRPVVLRPFYIGVGVK